MKSISLLLSITFSILTISAFAQLKVDQYGRIGMGTNYPNPSYKCHVAGNLLCTSYPANPSYELRLKVGNGWPGCEIGATSDILAFWTSEYGYTSLRASDFSVMSDSTVKKNILPIIQPLNRLMEIRPVHYTIEDNKINGATGEIIKQDKQNFGFLSQQIRDLFPEAKITAEDHNGYILLDYNQLLPIAVASIQTQQNMIDSLKFEMANLKLLLNSGNLNGLVNNDYMLSSRNVLNQNSPNPFNESTELKFSIQEQNFRNALIVIFDLNGLLIKAYDIQNSGEGSIKINGNELKAGMYYNTPQIQTRDVTKLS